jgi:hypothetical protein
VPKKRGFPHFLLPRSYVQAFRKRPDRRCPRFERSRQIVYDSYDRITRVPSQTSRRIGFNF